MQENIIVLQEINQNELRQAVSEEGPGVKFVILQSRDRVMYLLIFLSQQIHVKVARQQLAAIGDGAEFIGAGNIYDAENIHWGSASCAHPQAFGRDRPETTTEAKKVLLLIQREVAKILSTITKT